MSQTTKNLNLLIARLDEDLTAQIKRAAEAERDLDYSREALYETQAKLQAKRTLDERHDRDMERYAERNARLEQENTNLRRLLDRYVEARKADAAVWLRETSIEDLTTLINADRDPDWGSRPYSPLNDKIPLIKVVRTKFELGLKESKDIVDAWYAEIAATFDGMVKAITEPHEDELTDAMIAASASVEPLGGIEQFQDEDR